MSLNKAVICHILNEATHHKPHKTSNDLLSPVFHHFGKNMLESNLKKNNMLTIKAEN
jgi:hypothetical protein